MQLPTDGGCSACEFARPEQAAYKRALATAGAANEPQLLSWPHVDVDALEHERQARAVPELHVGEGDLALLRPLRVWSSRRNLRGGFALQALFGSHTRESRRRK